MFPWLRLPPRPQQPAPVEDAEELPAPVARRRERARDINAIGARAARLPRPAPEWDLAPVTHR